MLKRVHFELSSLDDGSVELLDDDGNSYGFLYPSIFVDSFKF